MPELEIGAMFWAGGNPAETLEPLVTRGFQSGQLGIPGDLDLACASAWRDATLNFRIYTVFAAYAGESYADIRTVVNTVGFVPPATLPEREQRTLDVSDFAATIGAPGIATHVGAVPHDPADPVRIAVAASVRRICDHAARHGQTFALETGQEPADILLDFLREVNRPNLGINFDPANMLLYGTGDPVEALDVLGPHLISVHCKDGDRPPPEVAGALGQERALGAGSVGIPAFVNKLKQIGYRGPLVIEREGCGQAQWLEDLAAGLALLRKAL